MGQRGWTLERTTVSPKVSSLDPGLEFEKSLSLISSDEYPTHDRESKVGWA